MSRMNRIIDFDRVAGIIHAEVRVSSFPCGAYKGMSDLTGTVVWSAGVQAVRPTATMDSKSSSWYRLA